MRAKALPKTVLAFLLVVFTLGGWPDYATACPDGYYNSCVLGACVCLPTSGMVVNGATRPLHGVGAATGGTAVEQWIVQSHNTSVNGAAPIPPGIRQQLEGYSDDDAMNWVRYRIGDSGILNAANNIEHIGETGAVTLIDVIVFRGPTEANDPALWAHELTHVAQ